MRNAYQIVEQFEYRVAKYTGAPYACAVDSCTNALLLCLSYVQPHQVEIPTNTYVGVANAIIHAGGTLKFREEVWSGTYQLKPCNIYDSAKRLTSDMYIKGSMMCLSFHVKKLLNIGRGGMIIHDNKNAQEWFKRMRWDGRTGKNLSDEQFFYNSPGYNCYMTPELAARGLELMMHYPRNKPDMEWEYYGNLKEQFS